MFKGEYQRGAYFEVFNTKSRDPSSLWKIVGPGVKRAFNDELRCYVYNLEGTASTSKIQFPKDPRQGLGLTQNFIILQIYVPSKADFSVELGICDINNFKRRMLFSTSHKELSHSPPSLCKLPLKILKKNQWLNLTFDLRSLVGELWRDQRCKSLESITISANCRLCRIFTMLNEPRDTSGSGDSGIPSEASLSTSIPDKCDLPHNVDHITQIMNPDKMGLLKNYRSSSATSTTGSDSGVSPINTSHGSRKHASSGSRLKTDSASSNSAPSSADSKHQRSVTEPISSGLETQGSSSAANTWNSGNTGVRIKKPHPPPREMRDNGGSGGRRRIRVRPAADPPKIEQTVSKTETVADSPRGLFMFHNPPRAAGNVQEDFIGSQSRCSLSRNHVREITQAELQVKAAAVGATVVPSPKATASPIPSRKYAPPKDLSDSAEIAMLAYLASSADNSDGDPEPLAESPGRRLAGKLYRQSAEEDEEEDESDAFLTSGRSAHEAAGHGAGSLHYQKEMEDAFPHNKVSREALDFSNPHVSLRSAKSGPKAIPRSKITGGSGDANELDLLFDAVLNCYYDPVTFKYYELLA